LITCKRRQNWVFANLGQKQWKASIITSIDFVNNLIKGLRQIYAQKPFETAQNMQFNLGVTEDDVLIRCLQGLQAEASVVSATEAQWVVHRLAELLNWPLLDNAPGGPVTQ
jgi:hypothetical protein